MHGDALNTRISAQAEQAGDPAKRERDACREERFPWEIESAAWYASADEKVVRERLHNRPSPSRAAEEVQKSAQLCHCGGSRAWVGLIYDDGACCAGQLSGPGWP